jgi:hypothetical protein
VSVVRFRPKAPYKCGFNSVVECHLAKVKVASSNLVFPLHIYFRRHSQVVRQRTANPLPPVQIWVPPPFYNARKKQNILCRSGGIGRRTGLKILRSSKTVPVRFRSPAPSKHPVLLVRVQGKGNVQKVCTDVWRRLLRSNILRYRINTCSPRDSGSNGRRRSYNLSHHRYGFSNRYSVSECNSHIRRFRSTHL